MGVGEDASEGRNVRSDVEDCSPFREARALFVVLGQSVGELVETNGDEFARAKRERLGALVDLDARDYTRLFD